MPQFSQDGRRRRICANLTRHRPPPHTSPRTPSTRRRCAPPANCLPTPGITGLLASFTVNERILSAVVADTLVCQRHRCRLVVEMHEIGRASCREGVESWASGLLLTETE